MIKLKAQKTNIWDLTFCWRITKNWTQFAPTDASEQSENHQIGLQSSLCAHRKVMYSKTCPRQPLQEALEMGSQN